jgi:hypothetical protein
MTYRSNQHRAPGGGRRHGPTASALLRAVEREMDHLARAARHGTLEDLVPLAIPHGPLLANLHALHQDLCNQAASARAADLPGPAPTFTPITVTLIDTVGLPQPTVPERVARARSASAAPPTPPAVRRPPTAPNH